MIEADCPFNYISTRESIGIQDFTGCCVSALLAGQITCPFSASCKSKFSPFAAFMSHAIHS